MNADGSGVTQFAFGTFNDQYPAWRSGGQKIAFAHNLSVQVRIWTMNPDGTDQLNITAGIPNSAQSPRLGASNPQPFRFSAMAR